MKTIDIDLPVNAYPVYLGRGLLADGARAVLACLVPVLEAQSDRQVEPLEQAVRDDVAPVRGPDGRQFQRRPLGFSTRRRI